MGLLSWLRPKPKNTQEESYEYIVPNTIIAMPVNRRKTQRVNAKSGTQALIIDDSKTIVTALSKLLKSADYIVYTAEDAESGLEIAREELPQIIFLDILLPGMHGFSALRKIRRDPELQHIPVILMSGNAKAAEYFFQQGVDADDFMKKPFSRQEVFARIEPLLDEQRVPRRARMKERRGSLAAEHRAQAIA